MLNVCLIIQCCPRCGTDSYKQLMEPTVISLTNSSNKRTDKWGGSVENRARFGLEALKAVVGVFGSNAAIEVSLCGGYNDVGMLL